MKKMFYIILKNFKYLILVTVIFALNSSLSIAQTLDIEKFNTTDGLSNNKVYYIFQDSYGLLWIGTEYGLNLYDGYGFKIFKNEPGNPESINSNVIWWIVEDEEKNLWISTGEGVSKYIRAENKFKNYDFYGDYFSSIAIHIDQKGNLWATVETQNILRYNKPDDTWEEQKFVLVDSSKSYNSPAHVTRILEDTNGKLWLASIKYGLMWYDENEKIFKQSEIILNDKVADFTIVENFITDLYSDSSGVLWITSRKGIYKYHPAQKIFKTIQTYDWKGLNLDDDYNSISQDQFGNIWITNNFNGLLKFEGISDTFSRIELSGQKFSNDGKSDLVLSRSLWDKSGNFWIGTFREGLIKYNPSKKIFSHYTHDVKNNNSISNSYIFSLLESKVYPGNIYVGTAGGGLNLFDSKTNTFSQIPIKFIKDVNDGSVRSILEEEDGSLWLGTWGDGLLRMNSKRKIVHRYYTDSIGINSISNERVRVIRKDISGNLWIGTDGGLNYFDHQTNTISRLSKEYIIYPQELIDLIKNKISKNLDEANIIKVKNSQNLSAEFEIKKPGNYLIVTAGEGGYGDTDLYDYGWIEDSKQKILWNPTNSDSTFHIGGHFKNRVKIAILKLNRGKYLLKYKSDDSHCYGNWNEDPPLLPEFWGIRIFQVDDQRELETIQKYLTDMKTKLMIKGSNILDILLNNNIVWVGTQENGLQKINRADKNIKTYLLNDENNNAARRISINNIFEDNENNLWLATNHGLIKFDPIKETLITYNEDDGLQAHSIYSILPGDSENLWLSTNNGISKMIRNTTDKPTFVNYGSADDVGGIEFTNLVALKSSYGKYFFGGKRGLIEFSSERSVCPPPDLILSDLKISNKSLLGMNENSPLESSLYDLSNLSLTYTQNDLTFEYSALHYCEPRKNKYAHQLEGYEKNWLYDDSRIATYTNLDPGEYIFKFKGSNSDGIWNESGKAISIIITPPWWQTWWAYIIYTFCFLSLLGGLRIFELKRRKEKEDKRVLELENERKTKELEEARALQLSMLPKELPKVSHLDIAVYMKTATEVGGDYYDFHVESDGTLTVVIGDATGHGMNAGTMVTATKSLFQNLAGAQDLKHMFHQINRSLYLMNLQPLFMSLIAIRIKNNNLEIINGGMPDLLIYEKENNMVKEIKSGGPPLGAFVNHTYMSDKSKISKNDVILLMSDGFAERFNENDEMLDYKRCINFYHNVASSSPSEIIDSLIKKGDEWAGRREQDDDITFVILKHN
jgi:serine phosphatase RsbU (regulator of sigma subunit)/ligand-binding sensor domain-containing protein